MDTGVLARVLDDVLEYGGDYKIARLDLGRQHHDESYARIEIGCADPVVLQRILMRLQIHGVNLADPGEALLRPAEKDGVFPADFYSTTNLETLVKLEGSWVGVDQPEMDCGLVVRGGPGAGERSVHTVPVSDVRAGDLIVCGASGVRVLLPAQDDAGDELSFEFMSSEVSSERPQALQVRLIAGNALATHDIESALYGTSLGVDLSRGRGVPHGHEHHIRAINTIRRCGSITAAVKEGVLTGGVMHAMVEAGREFVLVGSVRDDGPLPDVYTDVIAGQRAMRAQLADVGFCIVVATMLHGIATGNILPASIPLVCVDINPATVTKLADRGSAQAIGIVTDIGLFFEQLARELVPSYGLA